jgi:hypothetical protein
MELPALVEALKVAYAANVALHMSHVTRHTSRHIPYTCKMTHLFSQVLKPKSDEQLLHPDHPVLDAFLKTYDSR